MTSTKPTRGNVFRSTRKANLVAADRLLVLFHRAATILYVLLGAWGVIGAVIGVQSLQMALGDELQSVYGVAVAIVALVSAGGAMYFPQRSRVEMFAASTLVTLMAGYPVALAWIVFHGGDEAYTALMVFSLTALVIPAVRVLFVYQWMIDTAKKVDSEGKARER